MSMVAEHAKWPKENDIIFSLSERAQAAEKELGKDKVINATILAISLMIELSVRLSLSIILLSSSSALTNFSSFCDISSPPIIILYMS